MTSLIELGPVIAAVLGPMLAFVVVSMRYQHVDGNKTRELIAASREETRRLDASSREETRELIERTAREIRDETRELIGQSAREIRDETRELIGQSAREIRDETRELINGVSAELAEHRSDTKESFREVTRSLADARERLARIEGHLGVGTLRPGEQGGNTADAA